MKPVVYGWNHNHRVLIMCLHVIDLRWVEYVTLRYVVSAGTGRLHLWDIAKISFADSLQWPVCNYLLCNKKDSSHCNYNRIVDRWNSLSECCVTCNSINCFKSHYFKWTGTGNNIKCWYFGEWALYGIKPVPTKPSVRRYCRPSVNTLFTL